MQRKIIATQQRKNAVQRKNIAAKRKFSAMQQKENAVQRKIIAAQ